MYEQVFNLTSRPFTSTHYVKHYFAAKAIEESLQQSLMLIDRGSGPVVVIGDHGTGKTLLLAILEESFKSNLRVVNISASLIRSREDLLQNILFQLQMNYRGLSEAEMRLDMIEMLKSEQSKDILLMIDDAQKLTPESIEEAQTLADYVRETKPCIRLLLAGSQGLEERLADNRLVSFNQRIAGRFFLSCLNREEVEAYVRAHVERASGDPDKLFDPECYRAIHEVSEGRARYINQVCDHAMIFAATRGAVPITDSLIREAWYDIQKLPGAIAPSGSGGMSDPSLVSQDVETDADGWTVLEFGELSDSEDASDEQPAEREVAATLTEEEFASTQVQEEPATAQSDTGNIPGHSFSVNADGEMQTTPLESKTEEPEEAESDTPSNVGGAAILASALAGFGVLVHGSNDSDEENEAQSETEAQPEAEAAPEAEPEAQQAVETTEESPAAPAMRQVAETTFTPPETEAAAEKDATETFEDPFASEEFDNEEVLTDAYSPFVAQQNQRSLEVTSEQLQNLTPGDSVQWNESEPEAKQDEEESFPTFESAMEAPEPVREPIKPELEARESLETREESDVLGEDSLSEEFLLHRKSAMLSDAEPEPATEPTAAVDVTPIEANPGSGFVPLDPNAASVLDSLAPKAETPSTPVPAPAPAPVADVAPVADAAPVAKTNSKFHEQAPSPEDPEIRRQAEEIIRSLNTNSSETALGVTPEIPAPPETIQQETSAIEQTIQRSFEQQPKAAVEPEPAAPPVVIPDLGNIQSALRKAQDEHGYRDNSQSSDTASDGQIPVSYTHLTLPTICSV